MFNRFNKFGYVALGAIFGMLLSLNISVFAEKMAAPQLPLDDLRAFAEIFGKIKSDYVEPVEDKKLITEAINGMLTGLDPHSTYLDADGFKDLQAGTQGEFGGLGIEVGMEDGLVKVVSPIEDSPAHRAGIRTNDLIFKLDDAQVKGMTLNDAVKKMRGKPDTSIVLTILRKGEANPLTFKLTRAVIKNKSVKPKLTQTDYGYVRITQFQEHTGEDLANALKALHDENKTPLKGFVLDLRNNPGGLLNAAVGVSAAFIPKDELVVYTEGRAEDAKMQLTANADNYVRGGASKGDYISKVPAEFKNIPMVVLVNGGSASASEIVAGALQDHKRAVVMGTQSFGKGSVQTILPMNNGSAIKLTTARYFTPKGRSIQAKGIVPDIIVDETANGPLDRSLSVKEADLSGHLSNPKEAEAPNKNEGVKVPQNESKYAEKFTPIEFGSKDDYQLNQALNLLKGVQIMGRK